MIEKQQKTANLAKLTLTTFIGTKTFKLISSNLKKIIEKQQKTANLAKLTLTTFIGTKTFKLISSN